MEGSGVLERAKTEWESIELQQTMSSFAKEADQRIKFEEVPNISFTDAWLALGELEEDLNSGRDNLKAALKSSNFPSPPTPCCCLMPGAPDLPPTLQSEVDHVLILTRIPFKEERIVHCQMLKSIYTGLKPTHSAPSRIGPHWELIGFQGDDPATDLRGMGIFALVQLLSLVSQSDKDSLSPQDLDRLIQLSADGEQSYPLAVVGVNFSKFIIIALRMGLLNRLIIRRTTVISTLNQLYRGAFVEFYRIWSTRKCSIVDFGPISNEIEKMIRRKPKKLSRLQQMKQSSKLPTVVYHKEKQEDGPPHLVSDFSQI